MKRQMLILAILAAVAFVVGCNQEQTPAQQLDKIQAEAKQAAQDIKGYTYAQKTAFVAKMQSQLDEINRNLVG